jgi:ribosome-binding protein aMBF1 (putative translation factor)
MDRNYIIKIMRANAKKAKATKSTTPTKSTRAAKATEGPLHGGDPRLHREAAKEAGLGGRMRHAMEARGISNNALADLIDASKGAVRFWTSGFRKPTDENLAKVAKVLGVSASYLRTGTEG